MAKKGGDIIFYLIGDDRKLRSTLRQTSAHFADVGRSLLIGGGAVAGFIGLAVKAATDAEKVGAQLDAVLKSTGRAAGQTRESVLSYSSELQRMTTFEDEAITSAQALLLTFTNVKGDVFKEGTKLALDMSTAMGQDLQSSIIQIGKALNDPVKGMTALTRVGVTFTEQQKEQIENLVQAGDLMGAQRIILAELSKEFGGSAAAQAETFAGKLIQLKNKGGDLLELIGEKLIPKLEQLVDRFRAWIDQHGDEFAERLANALLAVVSAVAGLTNWAADHPKIVVALLAIAAAVKAIGIAWSLAQGVMGLSQLASAGVGKLSGAGAAGAAGSATAGAASGIGGKLLSGAKGLLGKAGTVGAGLLGGTAGAVAATAVGAGVGGYLLGQTAPVKGFVQDTLFGQGARDEADQRAEAEFQRRAAEFAKARASQTTINVAHANVMPGTEAFQELRMRHSLASGV